jgi:hypothetical protein
MASGISISQRAPACGRLSCTPTKLVMHDAIDGQVPKPWLLWPVDEWTTQSLSGEVQLRRADFPRKLPPHDCPGLGAESAPYSQGVG